MNGLWWTLLTRASKKAVVTIVNASLSIEGELCMLLSVSRILSSEGNAMQPRALFSCRHHSFEQIKK